MSDHVKTSELTGPRRWTLEGADDRNATLGDRIAVGPALFRESVEVMPVSEHQEEVEHFRRAVAIAEEGWARAEAELEALREAAQALVGVEVQRRMDDSLNRDECWSPRMLKAIDALRAALGEKP